MKLIIEKVGLRPLSIALSGVFLVSCQLIPVISEPAGSEIVADSRELGELSPWTPLTLQAFPEANKHAGPVLAVKENPSAAGQVLSVGGDGSVIGWDLQRYSGHKLATLATPITLAALGESTPLVAYYGSEGISITCLHACKQSWQLKRLKIRPTSLAFHGKDSALLIAGADGRIYRWRFFDEDRATSVRDREKLLERYVAHQNIVSAVTAHPFGRAFFSGDWNGALFGWLPYSADHHGGEYDRNLFGARFYTDKANFVQALRKADRGISAMTVSLSGERLGIGSEDGYVEMWEIKGFVQSARAALHSGRVISIAFDTDGGRVASVGRDMMVTVSLLERDAMFGTSPQALPWKLTMGTRQRIENAKDVIFLKSGDLLVTTADGAVAEVSDLKTPPAPPTPTPRASHEAQDLDY